MDDQKQILIVEDTDENVVFLSEILKAHGYAYRVARNGAEALVELNASRPDAVLLDIMMPQMTGIAAFHRMKKDPDLRDIPVIVITGASKATGVDPRDGETRPAETYGDEVRRDLGKSYHEKFKNLEPDGYLEKPITPQALVQELTRLLT